MTAERYDGADWPATISVGPGYYGLRLPQEYGTIVEYVHPRSLSPEHPCRRTGLEHRIPRSNGTARCDAGRGRGLDDGVRCDALGAER